MTLPYALAVDPETDTVYVANDGVGSNGSTVSVIDGGNNTVSGTIALPPVNGQDTGPTALVFDPVNEMLYVADTGSDSVTVIDNPDDPTLASFSTISLGGNPGALAVDPSSGTVYVGYDAFNNGTVAVVSEATNSVTATFSVGGIPQSMALDPTLGFLYVSYPSATASAYDVSASGDNTFVGYISYSAFPQGLDVDTTTDVAYVTFPDTIYPQDGLVEEDDGNALIEQQGGGGNPGGLYESDFSCDEPIAVAVDSATDTAYVVNSGTGGNDVCSAEPASLSVLSASPIVPAAPTAVAGTQQATVTVAAPSPGSGGTPTGYTVTATDTTTAANGGQTCTISGAGGSCNVDSLTAGDTYTFTATATNAVGTSPPSDASNAVTVESPATLAVSSVSPDSGSVSGGTAITITGTDFATGATVVIGQGSGSGAGAIAATGVDVVSSTEITAFTGGGAKAGTFSLFVTSGGSTSVGHKADDFTYENL
ncbi:MAG: IPT/TIG domain-containing protein [Acidimicrobiales bacterium]